MTLDDFLTEQEFKDAMKSGEKMKVVFEDDYNELLNRLKEICDDYQSKEKYYIKKIQDLTSKHWKDDTMAKMLEELDAAREAKHLGFPMTRSERNMVRAWQEQHIQEEHNGDGYAGAIGGNFVYEFTPTAIGVIGICYCPTCRRAGKDFNDSEITFQNI